MKYIYKEDFDKALNDVTNFVDKHSQHDNKKNIAHIKNCLATIQERSDNLEYEEKLYNDLFSRYNVYWQTLRILEKTVGLKVTAEIELNNETHENEMKFYIRTQKGDLVAELTKNEFDMCIESNFLNNHYQDPKEPEKPRKCRSKNEKK